MAGAVMPDPVPTSDHRSPTAPRTRGISGPDNCFPEAILGQASDLCIGDGQASGAAAAGRRVCEGPCRVAARLRGTPLFHERVVVSPAGGGSD